MHPFSKLAGVLGASLSALILPPVANGVLLSAVLLMALLHGKGRQFIKGLLALSAPFALSLLLIGAADPAVPGDWWSMGPLGLGPEQLTWVGELLVRLTVLVGSLQLYIMTTRLDDLHACLVRARVPKSLAYALVAAAGFVPHLRQRVLEVRDAQTSRGVRFGWGSLGALSLVGPLLLSTLEEAADREVTLLVRGFGLPDRPTVLADVPWRRSDTAFTASVLLSAAVALLWRTLGS